MLTDLGVVDLAVTEVLWRLTDADDYVVDAGANIGCMTAVFAARVSGADGGHILALEAHPVICHDLQRNIDLWAADSTVEVIGAALSNIEGTVTLVEPAGFSGNRGLAHVASGTEETGRRTTVPARTLDRLVPAARVVGVLKLDVEGHELHALEGAQHLLREARIRDCVFEDHGKVPSPVMSVLETYGFEIFRIERSLRGPLLLARDAEGHTDWLPANYLATKAPERAQRRCATRGWQTLRRRA